VVVGVRGVTRVSEGTDETGTQEISDLAAVRIELDKGASVTVNAETACALVARLSR
jgi:hypothetical protein